MPQYTIYYWHARGGWCRDLWPVCIYAVYSSHRRVRTLVAEEHNNFFSCVTYFFLIFFLGSCFFFLHTVHLEGWAQPSQPPPLIFALIEIITVNNTLYTVRFVSFVCACVQYFHADLITSRTKLLFTCK